jgi:hypothetical protein
MGYLIGWRLDRQKNRDDHSYWQRRIEQYPACGAEEPKMKRDCRVRLTGIYALVGLVIGFLMLLGMSGNPETQVIEHEDVQIVSIRDGSGTNGGGFLTLNTVSTKYEYVYYAQGEDGSFEQKQLPSRSVKVFQEDIEHPYLRKLIGHSKDWKWYLDAGMMGYEFHLPKGAIIQDYVLDAE